MRGQRAPGPTARQALKCAQSLAGAAAPREPFPSKLEDCWRTGKGRAFLLAFAVAALMKKSAFTAALLFIAAGLSGCPIYDDDDAGCYTDSDCASGFVCDDRDQLCYEEEESGACRRPSDCGTNETCSRSGTCMTGDCHFASVGCVRGYECSAESGRWQCVSDSAAPSAGGAGGDTSATPGGGEPNASGGAPTEASAGSAG